MEVKFGNDFLVSVDGVLALQRQGDEMVLTIDMTLKKGGQCVQHILEVIYRIPMTFLQVSDSQVSQHRPFIF